MYEILRLKSLALTVYTGTKLNFKNINVNYSLCLRGVQLCAVTVYLTLLVASDFRQQAVTTRCAVHPAPRVQLLVYHAYLRLFWPHTYERSSPLHVRTTNHLVRCR
jgi:hypothetical protein